MTAAFLDTHAAVLLWEHKSATFGRKSRALLDTARLHVSPIVALELQYLYDIKRLCPTPEALLADLSRESGVELAHDDIADVVTHAATLTWTRDPFDRLLVGHALLRQLPFITRDRVILANLPSVVW